MKEIILAMMMWINTATGYSIPEIPDINYLPTMELRSYAFGCDQTPIPTHNIELCAAKKNWDQLEKEAYTLQDEWLQEKYNVNVWDTIKINKLFFMMITNCRENHWSFRLKDKNYG